MTKLTRKASDQMRETKFLQTCSFSTILTSLHSLNFSFSLLYYVISTTRLMYPPWFPTSLPWFAIFFAFPPRFPEFLRWFSAPAFPSHSSDSHPYSPHFPPFVPNPHFVLQSLFSLLLIVCSVCNLQEFILGK